VNVLRAIIGPATPRVGRSLAYAAISGAGTLCLSTGLLVMLSLRESRGGTSNAAWERHRAEIRGLPEERYHRDRFRSNVRSWLAPDRISARRR
jgi:hypothetical protein